MVLALQTTGPMPTQGALEIRLHGRGGQGGVTCAKLLAAAYVKLGKSVQTFGDYAGERSGAPVRAYTRVSDSPITNRNKVYSPDHLLILDPTLIGDDTVAGLAAGATVLINTADAPAKFRARLGRFRIATVDATAIAREHGIGTRTVVIVNTTITGAYAKVVGIPLPILEETYRSLGFSGNFPAARQAYESVHVLDAEGASAPSAAAPPAAGAVLALTDHTESAPTGLKTGAWRSQKPQYAEHLAPCSAWCPAGNDVIGFVRALCRSEAEASAILGRSTPLAAVCGRVCPAPCMDGCNRRDYDGAVNIRALERWTADQVPVAQRPVMPAVDRKRIAVVGGGPAGLSAAYHAAILGHEVVIYEGERQLGGLLRTGIPEYRLPRSVLDAEIDAIIALGVEVHCGTFLSGSALRELAMAYDGVIVATGLQRLRGFHAPGSDLTGIEQGIEFLHRVNMQGDARLDGHVVVLGGGNTAIDCARSALRVGAHKVTVAYRRTDAEMPAIREEIEAAVTEGVSIELQRAPVGFEGGGHVGAVLLAEVDMGDPDDTGRRRPIVSSRRQRIECDHVLLALGQLADTSLLPKGWTVTDGRILDNEAPSNVFVCGDMSTGDGTVTHAIGDGRRAVGRALRAAQVEVEVFERPNRAEAVPSTDIRFDHFSRVEPAKDRLQTPQESTTGFTEVNLGCDGAGEAERCFSCGHCTECDRCLVYCPEGIVNRIRKGYEIDYAFCKGCGICVAECPRCAMEMVQ